MSNKQLTEALNSTLQQNDPAAPELELTDGELDDVSGGGVCGAMCETFHVGME